MRKSIIASLIAVMAMPSAIVAQSPTISLESASRVWVKGTSSVRAWECQAPTVVPRITAAGQNTLAAVLAGEKAIDSVLVSIPSAAMDCRNGTMTGHMKKAIKVAEFDSITFALKTYALAPASDDVTITMEGTLTLGGVTKDVTITALGKATAEGLLQVAGTYELSMKDYGLKAPSLMLGTMKVHDKVTVGFDLLLKN